MTASGSSPRVRGTRGKRPDAQQLHGIIPACAGNTIRRRSPTGRSRDHPRVCGEHATAPVSLPTRMGSSPRVRGTPTTRRPPPPTRGIIPACAGNTVWLELRREMERDHPRVCGEHDSCRILAAFVTGSSPRVRGTLCIVAAPKQRVGIIPACAGNTS